MTGSSKSDCNARAMPAPWKGDGLASRQVGTTAAITREAANITVERNHSHSWPVTRTKGVELAAKVAADLGLPSKQVMTFAGPDSINITDLVPTVTLFVPNVDGISHNEHE